MASLPPASSSCSDDNVSQAISPQDMWKRLPNGLRCLWARLFALPDLWRQTRPTWCFASSILSNLLVCAACARTGEQPKPAVSNVLFSWPYRLACSLIRGAIVIAAPLWKEMFMRRFLPTATVFPTHASWKREYERMAKLERKVDELLEHHLSARATLQSVLQQERRRQLADLERSLEMRRARRRARQQQPTSPAQPYPHPEPT